MDTEFQKKLMQKLSERQDTVSQPLLTNGCNTLEHFKYVSGVRQGLLEAMQIAIKIYKEIYEEVNLINNSGGTDVSKRRKSNKTFY